MRAGKQGARQKRERRKPVRGYEDAARADMIRCPRAEQERNGVTQVECRLDASRLDTRHAPGLDQDREAAGIDHVGNAGTEPARSEEHTSELQSLLRISYAVFCLKKQTHKTNKHKHAETRTQV